MEPVMYVFFITSKVECQLKARKFICCVHHSPPRAWCLASIQHLSNAGVTPQRTIWSYADIDHVYLGLRARKCPCLPALLQGAWVIAPRVRLLQGPPGRTTCQTEKDSVYHDVEYVFIRFQLCFTVSFARFCCKMVLACVRLSLSVGACEEPKLAPDGLEHRRPKQIKSPTQAYIDLPLWKDGQRENPVEPESWEEGTPVSPAADTPQGSPPNSLSRPPQRKKTESALYGCTMLLASVALGLDIRQLTKAQAPCATSYWGPTPPQAGPSFSRPARTACRSTVWSPGCSGRRRDSWPATRHFSRQGYCHPCGIRDHANPSPPFISAVRRAECFIDICIKCHKS